MLPTSGYFRDILCPFLKSGLCERTHCHYRHDKRYEVKASTSKSSQSSHSVPDYVPTPVSKLKTPRVMTSDDNNSITVDNNKSKTKFQNIYQNIPEYKPTPISQLKKQQIGNYSHNDPTPDHKPKSIKSPISSSDESTNGKRKKSSDIKSNEKQKKVIKSETNVSKSAVKSTEKSDKKEIKTKTKDKKDLKQVFDFDSDSNEDLIESLNKISKSSVRKTSFDEIIGSADEGYESVAKKSPKKLEKKALRPTPTQVMNQRYSIVAQNNKSPTKLTTNSNTGTNSNKSSQISNKTRIAHKPSAGDTDPKVKSDSESVGNSVTGKRRIAHTPSAAKRPVLIGGVSNKFALKTRQQFLNKFIDEYLVFCGEDEAFKRGLESEKSVYDRSKSENIYKVFSVHEVKKIRTESAKRLNSSPSKMALTAEQMKKFGNQVVSHEMILNGKISGSFSVEKRQKSLTVEDLNDIELYKVLSKYIMSESQLKEYGYPRPDPFKRGSVVLPKVSTKIRNNYESRVRNCSRCQKTYTVDDDEMPTRREVCIFHSGRVWNERFNKTIERKYSCCKNDVSAGGCCSNPYHIIDGFDRPDYCDSYVRTLPLKPAPQSGYYGIYGVDCEMCYTTHGLELTRVTVVSVKQQTIYESLVKPSHPILDYNSKFSGIKESDLQKVTTTIKDVQTRLQTLFNDKTILIGHSLDSDLKALKLIHNTAIDTAQVFPHKRGLPFKRALRTLTAEFLKKIIQDDVDGHDSCEDAMAALKLMFWKVCEDLKKFKR